MPAGGVRRHPRPRLRPLRTPFDDHPVRRYAWAFAHLAGRRGRHLDLGIGDGAPFLRELVALPSLQVVGADAHAGYLQQARALVPAVPLVRVDRSSQLPFRDGAFDSATLLDVLEHVGDEDRALAELARVLAPGGLLLMSVPALHALSTFDPDDVKHRFPRLHRLVMSRRYPGGEYERRFVDADDGLIGDLDARRDRHENYRLDDLVTRVSRAGFTAVSRTGSGWLGRPLDALRLLSPAPLAHVVAAAVRADGRAFRTTNHFVAFERDGGPAVG